VGIEVVPKHEQRMSLRLIDFDKVGCLSGAIYKDGLIPNLQLTFHHADGPHEFLRTLGLAVFPMGEQESIDMETVLVFVTVSENLSDASLTGESDHVGSAEGAGQG
jgi:hypothetical protein